MPMKLHQVTKKRYINQQDNKDKISLPNRLFDKVFKIHDAALNNEKTVDVGFDGCSFTHETKIYLRQMVVECVCDGYEDNNKLIEHRDGYLLVFSQFIEYLKAQGIKDILTELNSEVQLGFYHYMLKEPLKTTGKVISYQYLTGNYTTLFHRCAIACSEGEISWYTTKKLSIHRINEYLMAKYELHYCKENALKWYWGGSLDTLSFMTSIYMLAYCIEQLESVDYMVISSYCTLVRTTDAPIDFYYRRNPFTKRKRVGHYMVMNNAETLDAEYIYENIAKKANKYDTKEETNNTVRCMKLWQQSVNKKIEQLNIEIKRRKLSFGPLPASQLVKMEAQLTAAFDDRGFIRKLKSLELNSGTSGFNNLIEHFTSINVAIISILTGFRVSEIRNLKAFGVLKESNNELWVSTGVDKTHSGFEVDRTAGDMVTIAINSMIELSFIDRTEKLTLVRNGIEYSDYPSLWCNLAGKFAYLYANSASKKEVSLCASRGRMWFNDKIPYWMKKNRTKILNSMLKYVYDKTLEFCPKDVRESIEKYEEGVTIHGCRHLFVDYLMRRFCGDTHKAMKRHLAHSGKNIRYFKDAYTRDKSAPIQQKKVEKSFSIELIKKIAGDKNHCKFSGPTVEFLRKELDKIDFVDPREIEKFIEKLVNDEERGLERLVPHEYGYCMLFKSRTHLAECKDSNGVPKVNLGKSDMCIGCANLMVEAESHLMTLNQLLQIHLSIATQIKSPNTFLSKFPTCTNARFKNSERKIKVITELRKQLSVGS